MLLGSTVLEVGIGLAFLYAIFSLIVTSAREIIEALLQTRAIHLERGIRELLNDPSGNDLAQQIYSHPLVSSLYRGSYDPTSLLRYPNIVVRAWKGIFGGSDPWMRVRFRSTLPAYIPSRNFAAALLDIASRGPAGGYDRLAGPMTFATLRSGVTSIGNPAVRRALLIALDDARGDVDRARTNVEQWFDTSMDRVSGWYKKQTQWILLVLGLLLAIALNVDTLKVASALYHDDALRAVTVKQAELIGQRLDPADPARSAQAIGCPGNNAHASSEELAEATAVCANQRLEAIGYPIGWPSGTTRFTLAAAAGWLLTALALSLGAPFWFDLLNKMMVIRSTVKPDEKSPIEASKDKQPSAPSPPLAPDSQSVGGDDGENAATPANGAEPGSPPAGTQAAPHDDASAPDPDFQPHSWAQGNAQAGDL